MLGGVEKVRSSDDESVLFVLTEHKRKLKFEERHGVAQSDALQARLNLAKGTNIMSEHLRITMRLT